MPDKLNDFYEQAFMALFHTHDATKGGYRREKYSKLGFEDFKLVFAHFCFKSFFNSDYEFTESRAIEYIEKTKRKGLISKDFESEDYLEDLTKSVCMLVHEGLNYVFSHRSFQEYFAAVYTVQLDDIQQKEFIKKWLTDENYRRNSSFLNMLYDLQPARFVKNILRPSLEELNQKFIENNEAIDWLIREMVDRIMVFKDEDGDKYFVGAHIRNHYYEEMITRACAINNYKSPGDVRNDSFINFLIEKYGFDEDIEIAELLSSEKKDDTIKELSWIKNRFDFAINSTFMPESDFSKKNMKDMLDEL